MKISLLCPDLSSHALVRTYPMARALARRYEVEIIGPLIGNANVYEPYRTELPYKPIRLPAGLSPGGLPRYLSQWLSACTGSVIYAFKPAVCSFGAALWLRRHTGAPVLLDIEDWDAADFRSAGWSSRLRSLWTGLHHLASPQTFGLMEYLVGAADDRIVASRFLQNRYGGTRIVHGADCLAFDPARFEPTTLRAKFGLAAHWKIILFAGTLLAHKGGRELAAGFERAARPELRLLVIGRETADLRALAARMGGALIHLGPRPHHEMPQFLAMADMVALPQRDTQYARAQIPGKVFEAMAMAKPIIASAVSDLPEILNGCGIVVPAHDPGALCQAILRVVDDASLAAELGRRARKKCMEYYSWDRMEQQLDEVVRGLIACRKAA